MAAKKKAVITKIKMPLIEVPAMESYFEVPDGPAKSATPDDIVKPDSDLDSAQKAQFAELLRTGLDLKTRAARLINLTKFTDSKRAPVALRAIQEINAITGITAEAPDEGQPLFMVVGGDDLAVAIKIPKK